MIKKKEYVVGFMFGFDKEQVLLIRKNRPEWQAGKLNGIGGKVEKDELPYNAMMREFKEEAGVENTTWTYFALLDGPDYKVYVYSSCDPQAFDKAISKTDELVYRVDTNRLGEYGVVPNLHWLVPMAKYPNDIFLATVQYYTKDKDIKATAV